MAHYSKADIAKIAETNPMLARVLVLGNDGGRSYAANGYAGDPPGTPAAPAAPVSPVANPPPTPPAMSAREQWRADVDRLGRSNSLADQGRARQLVLQGEPPEPAPAAPPATLTPIAE